MCDGPKIKRNVRLITTTTIWAIKCISFVLWVDSLWWFSSRSLPFLSSSLWLFFLHFTSTIFHNGKNQNSVKKKERGREICTHAHIWCIYKFSWIEHAGGFTNQCSHKNNSSFSNPIDFEFIHFSIRFLRIS